MPTTLTNGIQLPDKGSVDWYSSMQSNYNLIDTHLGDTDVHVTAEDKANWNSKQGSLSQDQLDAIAQVATNTLSALGVTVTNITSANFIEIGCDHPGGNEFLTGCVNDFRIYDHALSPKEIEILSRGLVCHYPLNGGGRDGDNIISGTSPNEVQYTYPSSSFSDKFSKISTIVHLSISYSSTQAGKLYDI